MVENDRGADKTRTVIGKRRNEKSGLLVSAEDSLSSVPSALHSAASRLSVAEHRVVL